MLIDIRAREITKWRKNAHRLALAISEIEETARGNDKILLALHKVALILIARAEKPKWKSAVESALTAGLDVASCRLIPAQDMSPALRKKIQALAADGAGGAQALSDDTRVAKGKSYFYLPLRRRRRVAGVLVLADTRADAFADDGASDYVRRLAEMLAQAL